MEPIMPKEGTQERIVLQHIKKRALTPLDAFKLYNITDLAGRVKRLEEKGWRIARTRKSRTDERGKELTHWTEYRIA